MKTRRSKFSERVESNGFQRPLALIEGAHVPPIILCDQAFPLMLNLMKPFANATSGTREAVFNYNLSRTRRVVENAFGRLKARFRFVMKRMECKLPNAKRAIKAACILHNICEDLGDHVEQQWEQEARAIDTLCQPIHNTGVCGGRGPEVSAALADYFWKRAHRAS